MLNLKKSDSIKSVKDSLAVHYFNKSLRSDPDDEILIAKNYNELAELNFENKEYISFYAFLTLSLFYYLLSKREIIKNV